MVERSTSTVVPGAPSGVRHDRGYCAARGPQPVLVPLLPGVSGALAPRLSRYRMGKRGRKCGIILLLARQSSTQGQRPEGGRCHAGIRANELWMKTDRGRCAAVGVTDER
jgi:hypothetical protein